MQNLEEQNNTLNIDPATWESLDETQKELAKNLSTKKLCQNKN